MLDRVVKVKDKQNSVHSLNNRGAQKRVRHKDVIWRGYGTLAVTSGVSLGSDEQSTMCTGSEQRQPAARPGESGDEDWERLQIHAVQVQQETHKDAGSHLIRRA